MILEALNECPNVKFLDLSHNCIGDTAVAGNSKLLTSHFFNALAENTSIEHISLRGNFLKGAHMLYFGDVLQRNCALRSVDLGENQLGIQGGRYIMDGLRSNEMVQDCQLSKTGVSTDLLLTIAQRLRDNRLCAEHLPNRQNAKLKAAQRNRAAVQKREQSASTSLNYISMAGKPRAQSRGATSAKHFDFSATTQPTPHYQQSKHYQSAPSFDTPYQYQYTQPVRQYVQPLELQKFQAQTNREFQQAQAQSHREFQPASFQNSKQRNARLEEALEQSYQFDHGQAGAESIALAESLKRKPGRAQSNDYLDLDSKASPAARSLALAQSWKSKPARHRTGTMNFIDDEINDDHASAESTPVEGTHMPYHIQPDNEDDPILAPAPQPQPGNFGYSAQLAAGDDALPPWQTTFTRRPQRSADMFTERDNQKIDNLVKRETTNRNFVQDGDPYWEKTLASHKSTINLDLSDRDIDDQGANTVARFIEHNPYLKVLDLSDNRITGRGAALIGQALARNRALKELDLSGNPLGEGIGLLDFCRLVGWRILLHVSVWNVHCKIKSASKSNSMSGHNVFRSFCSQGYFNSHLSHLWMRMCKLSGYHGQCLEHLVSPSRSLTHFDLSFNEYIHCFRRIFRF